MHVTERKCLRCGMLFLSKNKTSFCSGICKGRYKNELPKAQVDVQFMFRRGELLAIGRDVSNGRFRQKLK